VNALASALIFIIFTDNFIAVVFSRYLSRPEQEFAIARGEKLVGAGGFEPPTTCTP
jgi:hypothetical protein